jgi:hypothetical protein
VVYAIQRTLSELGESGCTFICEAIIAMRLKGTQFDLIESLYKAIEAKLIYYNERNQSDSRNMEVQNSQKLVELLAGMPIEYEYVGPDYIAQDDEQLMQEWVWKDKTVIRTHFVLPDYDPLGESNTRKNGNLKSVRVFRKRKNA